MPKTIKLFLNGVFFTADKRLIERYAPWSLVGRGVFETMRSYKGEIFLLDQHLDRLRNGLIQLGITPRHSVGQLKQWIEAALKTNKLQDARIRLCVWQDRSKHHVCILAAPLKKISSNVYERGFRVTVSDIRKDSRSVHSKVKSIRYQPMLTAYLKAQAEGFDEALMRNNKGAIAECSRSNIFIVKRGVLKTPPASSGCLNGITRQYVMDLARAVGAPVQVVPLTLAHIKRADEAFLTNSILEIMPLTRIETQKIGSGCSGPLTQALRQAY